MSPIKLAADNINRDHIKWLLCNTYHHIYIKSFYIRTIGTRTPCHQDFDELAPCMTVSWTCCVPINLCLMRLHYLQQIKKNFIYLTLHYLKNLWTLIKLNAVLKAVCTIFSKWVTNKLGLFGTSLIIPFLGTCSFSERSPK